MSDSQRCGQTRITGSTEWVCVRDPHAVPAPPERIQIGPAGAFTVQQVTETDRHYFQPRYPHRTVGSHP